jgi:putative spermidine/putrescine transport system permease protein
MSSATRKRQAVLLTTLPGMVTIGFMLLVPLVSLGFLSFNTYDVNAGIKSTVSFDNYVAIFTDSYYGLVFLRTLRIAFVVTLLSVCAGTLEAVVLSRMQSKYRSILLLVNFAPLLISVVSRTLGWALLIGPMGVLNEVLTGAGVVDSPLRLMYTESGVVLALTHVLVPFVVIAVWTSLGRGDPVVEKAAVAMGASPFTVFRRIILMQALPGILSGGVVVFSLAASAFATPQIIGGARLKVASTLAYDEFLNTMNWPLGAAVAVVLILAIVSIVTLGSRMVERRFPQVFK